MSFTDFEKTYNKVDRGKMIGILRDFSIPNPYTKAIQGTMTYIYINVNAVSWFLTSIRTDKELIQGSRLSLILFNLRIYGKNYKRLERQKHKGNYNKEKGTNTLTIC